MTTAEEIREAGEALKQNPADIGVLLRRGRLYYRNNSFAAAANDFARVIAVDPANTEAKGYLEMIEEIQNFRNTDLLNP